MLKYTIEQAAKGRLIIVSIKDLQRYRLYSGGTPLKFRPVSRTQAIAIALTDIKVYKCPNINIFHKELMLQNGRLQWHSQSSPDTEKIVTGLLEYQGII